MGLIKTIIAYIITILTIIIFTIPAIILFVLSFLGLKKPASWIMHKIAEGWARCIIFVSGCAIEVEGRENIPSGGSVCFVSNHVGIFDVVLTTAYAGRPFGFVAKKELIYLPFVNVWISILGGLYIDRKSIRNALKTINIGIKRIQNGESMLIFPEGTRSKGRGLLPFKSGAVKLATNSLAPIVPVAITGSYEVFEKNYLLNAVPVRMVFCPPIITAEMNPEDRKRHLTDQVRGAIENALSLKQPLTET